MKRNLCHAATRLVLMAACVALICCATPPQETSTEAFTATYISANRQSMALYRPMQATTKASTAIVVMHSHQDYMDFTANTELAARGYTVLATAPSSDDTMESKVLSVCACVDYLRSRGDIDRVVLLGHSGGATVMTAYGYLAEQGRAGLAGMIYTDYSDRIDHLPPIDGMLLLDANPGLSTIMINSIDPNVVDETRGRGTPTTYTEDDAHPYMQAQQRRYDRLLTYAEGRLQAIQAGQGTYTDDEPMVIPGSNSMRFFNKLYSRDTNLLAHTREPHPLIHADGSVTNEVVHTVRAPFQGRNATDRLGAAQSLTVREFLSTYAIRTTPDYAVLADGFRGIDFGSNLTSPIGNIRGVTVPTLAVGMTGSYEYLTSEAIYLNSPAANRTVAFVEGAGHMFEPDRAAAELHHADYGDTVKNLFDYVDRWLEEQIAKNK